MVNSRIDAACPSASDQATCAPESYGELFSAATQEISKLVRLEVELAKEELSTSIKKQTRAVGLIAAGAVFAFVNFVLMSWAAIYAIALVLPLWASVLIVSGLGLIVGVALALIGKKRLDPAELKPEATIQSTKNSVRYLANRIGPAIKGETELEAAPA